MTDHERAFLISIYIYPIVTTKFTIFENFNFIGSIITTFSEGDINL